MAFQPIDKFDPARAGSEPDYDSTEDPRSFWWEPSSGALSAAGYFNPPNPSGQLMQFKSLFSEGAMQQSLYDILTGINLSTISLNSNLQVYDFGNFTIPAPLVNYYPNPGDILVTASRDVSVQSYVNYASLLYNSDIVTAFGSGFVGGGFDGTLSFGSVVRQGDVIDGPNWQAFKQSWDNQQSLIAFKVNMLSASVLDAVHFTNGVQWTVREWAAVADNYYFSFTTRTDFGLGGAGGSYHSFAEIGGQYLYTQVLPKINTLILHEIAHQLTGMQTLESFLNNEAFAAANFVPTGYDFRATTQHRVNEQTNDAIALAIGAIIQIDTSTLIPPSWTVP